MKKEERCSRRNQLSVILVGWYRYRKERYCHSISYGVLLLGWVLVFYSFPSLSSFTLFQCKFSSRSLSLFGNFILQKQS